MTGKKTEPQPLSEEVLDDARNQKLDELEILKQSLDDAKKEAKEYYDQLLRLKAEFENFRKRSEKEKQSFLDYGREKILSKQLMIYDVLEAALKSAKTSNNLDSLLKGLELISKEFAKMLEEEGVKEVELKDNMFNPEFCEALDQEECHEENGKILNVYQKGYTLGGKLFRTAKVKVAASPNAQKQNPDSETEKQNETESANQKQETENN